MLSSLIFFISFVLFILFLMFLMYRSGINNCAISFLGFFFVFIVLLLNNFVQSYLNLPSSFDVFYIGLNAFAEEGARVLFFVLILKSFTVYRTHNINLMLALIIGFYENYFYNESFLYAIFRVVFDGIAVADITDYSNTYVYFFNTPLFSLLLGIMLFVRFTLHYLLGQLSIILISKGKLRLLVLPIVIHVCTNFSAKASSSFASDAISGIYLTMGYFIIFAGILHILIKKYKKSKECEGFI